MLLDNGITVDNDMAVEIVCQSVIKCNHLCPVVSRGDISLYCTHSDKTIECFGKAKSCDFCVVEKGEHPSTCSCFEEGAGTIEVTYKANGCPIKIITTSIKSSLKRIEFLYLKILTKMSEGKSEFLFGSSSLMKKITKIYEVCKEDFVNKYFKEYGLSIEKVKKHVNGNV